MSMAFVVTGNMPGAGILALPIQTGLSGLIPSPPADHLYYLSGPFPESH